MIECKRVRDTNWIFLIPSLTPNMDRTHFQAWLTDIERSDKKYFDWWNFTAIPPSPEAAFCIIPGQGPNDKPMLERICSELIEATETIAIKEYELNKNNGDFRKIYFTAIVTTAELKICKFDPKNISIENGEITNPVFETVPFIRFRKSFTTNLKLSSDIISLEGIMTAQERTVLVITASKLIEFLKSLE
ncbi:MAG: hypothetical protein AB1498_05325 [bacterium]